jgi:hypothetical protein
MFDSIKALQAVPEPALFRILATYTFRGDIRSPIEIWLDMRDLRESFRNVLEEIKSARTDKSGNSLLKLYKQMLPLRVRVERMGGIRSSGEYLRRSNAPSPE